jgi:hypothetical protein
MHDGICNRHDGLNSQLIFAEQTTSLTETSVKTPGSVLVRSVESDASWKSEIMAHATELHRSVLRMIVIAKRLNCRWGGGFLILKATSFGSVVEVSGRDLSLMRLRRFSLAMWVFELVSSALEGCAAPRRQRRRRMCANLRMGQWREHVAKMSAKI